MKTNIEILKENKAIQQIIKRHYDKERFEAARWHWERIVEIKKLNGLLRQELTLLLIYDGKGQDAASCVDFLIAEEMKNQNAVHKFEAAMPANKYGIAQGNYEINEIVELLRKHKNEPETIQFIADMLEE